MPALRALVRYGYAPFMMLGLTAAAYWVVAELVIARGTYLGLPAAGAAAWRSPI